MDWRDDRLYVAAGPRGLLVLDVGNPAMPVMLGEAPLGEESAVDVVVDSGRGVAFVAAGEGGVFAVDVSDPGAMAVLDQESTRPIVGVDLELEAWWPLGDILYGAAGISGIRRIDVSNPSAMVDITDPWPDTARAVDVASGIGFFGDYAGPVAYSSDDTFGLRVGEMGVGSFGDHRTADGAWAVDACVGCAWYDIVAAAAGHAGVYLFYGTFFVPTAPPAPARSLQVAVRPNPTRSVAELHVTLAVSGVARIEVFDALGRRMGHIERDILHGGTSALILDTAAWPAGVYLVRVGVGGESATTPVTIVR
jgi:hypothetical protein